MNTIMSKIVMNNSELDEEPFTDETAMKYVLVVINALAMANAESDASRN